MRANKRNRIVNRLLKWFANEGREFPWRKDRISLYKLLACEIFLWKTQANTVAHFIGPFFKKYPTPSHIEKASIKIVSRDIKKLGLSNRRARQLKQSFSAYSSKNIPRSEVEFRKRFRVGQYIARSVLAIYYDQKTFPVDQNINRFFIRVYNKEFKNIRKITREDNAFLKYFYGYGNKKLIWAVIDFASLICKNNSPKCGDCFLNEHCCHCKEQ